MQVSSLELATLELAHNAVPDLVLVPVDHDRPVFLRIESLVGNQVILSCLFADHLLQFLTLQNAQLVMLLDLLDRPFAVISHSKCFLIEAQLPGWIFNALWLGLLSCFATIQ